MTWLIFAVPTNVGGPPLRHEHGVEHEIEAKCRAREAGTQQQDEEGSRARPFGTLRRDLRGLG
jgi:hypothetical protein